MLSDETAVPETHPARGGLVVLLHTLEHGPGPLTVHGVARLAPHVEYRFDRLGALDVVVRPARGSSRTSTRPRSEHDLPSGWLLIQKREKGREFNVGQVTFLSCPPLPPHSSAGCGSSRAPARCPSPEPPHCSTSHLNRSSASHRSLPTYATKSGHMKARSEVVSCPRPWAARCTCGSTFW